MDLHVVSNDSLANYEVVVALNTNVVELLRLYVLILNRSDLLCFVVQCDETVSHFQSLLSLSIFVSLPLAIACQKKMVRRASELAA